MRTLPLLLLVACLKPAPPVLAAQRLPVRLVPVVESFDRTSVEAAPARALTIFGAEVERHNLELVLVDGASFTSSFERVRTTEDRLAAIGADDGAVLLLEIAPRFSAQVNGRYRWSVEADVTLVSTRADAVRARSLTLPVHLLYSHEDVAQAAIEAAPAIAREVGRLLDEWLAAP